MLLLRNENGGLAETMKEYWIFYVVDGLEPVDLYNCEIVILPTLSRVLLFLIQHRRKLNFVTIMYR